MEKNQAKSQKTDKKTGKQEKYQKEFTVYVKGQETYDAEVANAVAADIEKLVDDKNITRVRNRDSNPANNPQMPPRFRK